MKRALLILLALPLAGCRFTTFPLVPTELHGEFLPRLSSGSLTRDGNDLVLRVKLDARGKSGYLTVAWFREDAELSRDGAFLDVKEPNATLRLPAPDKGNYRAVVSFEGDVLRQFELPEEGGL